MSTQNLMKVTYYDQDRNIRLTGYADTVVWDEQPSPLLAALRFGGYPEAVRGLSDAIYGGATITIESDNWSLQLNTTARQYRRELGHDGVYRDNHKCEACGAPLWSALNPDAWKKQTAWGKIGNYGFVYRPLLHQHFGKAKSGAIKDQMFEMARHPDAPYPARGANRSYALSSYIKKKYKGRIYGLIVDELHQYNNASGQGDAMAELFGTAKKVVGMTATLINGYSSGIFHLLYRIVPSLMKKDGKDYEAPGRFDAEYGVIQNVYEEAETEYNSNRRTVKSKKASRLLPGVSPLVYTRFLLEYAAFLMLTDMGKDLPEYEEIPVPLKMPKAVREEYEKIERVM